MSGVLVVHGRYSGRTFVPNEPLPEVEGTAELKITPTEAQAGVSVFDLFGKAPRLRTGDDIAAQIREERDSWGEP